MKLDKLAYISLYETGTVLVNLSRRAVDRKKCNLLLYYCTIVNHGAIKIYNIDTLITLLIYLD